MRFMELRGVIAVVLAAHATAVLLQSSHPVDEYPFPTLSSQHPYEQFAREVVNAKRAAVRDPALFKEFAQQCTCPSLDQEFGLSKWTTWVIKNMVSFCDLQLCVPLAEKEGIDPKRYKCEIKRLEMVALYAAVIKKLLKQKGKVKDSNGNVRDMLEAKWAPEGPQRGPFGLSWNDYDSHFAGQFSSDLQKLLWSGDLPEGNYLKALHRTPNGRAPIFWSGFNAQDAEVVKCLKATASQLNGDLIQDMISNTVEVEHASGATLEFGPGRGTGEMLTDRIMWKNFGDQICLPETQLFGDTNSRVFGEVNLGNDPNYFVFLIGETPDGTSPRWFQLVRRIFGTVEFLVIADRGKANKLQIKFLRREFYSPKACNEIVTALNMRLLDRMTAKDKAKTIPEEEMVQENLCSFVENLPQECVKPAVAKTMQQLTVEHSISSASIWEASYSSNANNAHTSQANDANTASLELPDSVTHLA